MSNKKVLQQLESGELTSQEALDILYPVQHTKKVKPGKRATFIKFKINVPEEGKGINTFLRILFALPIPMVFARMGLRFASRFANLEDQEIDLNQISYMLKYSKNTKIHVDTDDAHIDISVI